VVKHYLQGDFFEKNIMTIVGIIVFYAITANTGFAGPLTNYAPGKTALDVNWLPSLQMSDSYNSLYDNGTDKDRGRNAVVDWGITTGLGNRWAVQYRQYNPETKQHFITIQQFGMKTQELNVLYKIDKNVSAFVGWHQAKYTFSASNNPNTTANNQNVLQTGLVGTMEIAPKTLLYGIVSVGSGLTNFEAGVGFGVNEDLDFNLFYRYKNVAHLKDTTWAQAYTDELTAKGFGLGFTWKF
jgi:hypothetical protein